MMWYKNKNIVSVKIISIAIVCLFTINNVAWANPDVFQKNNSCLSPQTAIQPFVSEKPFHEMMLKFYTKGIIDSIETHADFDLRITLPLFNGKYMVLDFENKELEGDVYAIPCAITDEKGNSLRDYVVAVDMQDKSVFFKEAENVRVKLLKKHIKRKTGASDVVKIEFPDKAEEYYLAFQKMVRALEEGKVVSLDLRNFENAKNKYRKLKNLFGDIGGNIRSKIIRGYVDGAIFELFKNAFYHGNKMDFNLPIFIHMDFDGEGMPKFLSVYDVASEKEIPEKEKEEARGILHGRGLGEDEIKKTYGYSRGDITHLEHGPIGTRATLLFGKKSPKRKPKNMSYGWRSSKTGIAVMTRGFDEKTVDGFKVSVGFIFSDPLMVEKIKASAVFSGYDMRKLKEVVLYNASDERYGKLSDRVKLVQEKDALLVPIKDPENAYTDVAKALWQVIQPKQLQYSIEEWDSKGKDLLETHDPEIIERIKRCLAWDYQTMDPDHLFAARSMWLRLKEPVEMGGSVFKYVKIKGVTYKGVFPSSSEEYEHGPRLFWRADESGRIISPTQTNILGAMSREKAKKEFDSMNSAFADGVSGACGIARGIFPDMDADGKGAGFIVMLVPEAPETTLPQLIFNHLPEIEAQAKTETLDESLTEFAGEMKSFIFNHGVQVRRGHDAGYFFGYPHHGNCIRYSGTDGFEFRMKDFESADIVDRESSRNKMIACRFIDVFQAVRHYRARLKKNPSLRALIEKAGFDPVRLFLEAYFSDRKDDPQIDLLYEALNSEDPYRPPKDKPVAEADHPAIKLIEEVERDISYQPPVFVDDLRIVWSGERKKEGLRVACAQIDMGPFEEDTERMAEIVKDLREKLGDDAPDLVIFPEEIRLKKDRPGREQFDFLPTAKEGGLKERTKALEKVARETGIAIGFCVSMGLKETYYTIVQPGKEKTRFRKMNHAREDRVFTVRSGKDEYNISLLICVETYGSVMQMIDGDPRLGSIYGKIKGEIAGSELLIIPSGMGTETAPYVAQRFFDEFHKPVAVLNLQSCAGPNVDPEKTIGGGNSVFISPELGTTALPLKRGSWQGIIMADVLKKETPTAASSSADEGKEGTSKPGFWKGISAKIQAGSISFDEYREAVLGAIEDKRAEFDTGSLVREIRSEEAIAAFGEEKVTTLAREAMVSFSLSDAPSPTDEEAAAGKPGLWKGIPTRDVKSIFYPACGYDAKSVVGVVKGLPHVEEIHLLDDNSQHHFERILSHFLSAFGEVASHIEESGERPTDESPDILMFRFRNKKTSKLVKVFFHKHDYFKVDKIRGLEDGSDLTIVKLPGYGGKMAANFHSKFYRKILDHTKKHIYVRNAFTPRDESILQKLKIVSSYMKPGREHLLQSRDHDDLKDIGNMVYSDEYVVYRKVRALEKIGGLNVTWAGELEKKGLRVAGIQIKQGDFQGDTERMAQIVRSCKEELGENAPDLIMFPEIPGGMSFGFKWPTVPSIRERMATLARAALETGISIGFCVGQKEGTYYTVIKSENGDFERVHFRKKDFDKEKRHFTLKTPSGEYKIFTLICVETYTLCGGLENGSTKESMEKVGEEIESSDLLMIPSAFGANEITTAAEILHEKFKKVPTATVNLVPPDDKASLSTFISPEDRSSTVSEHEGILIADIQKKGKDQVGLIGKWQVTSDITFIPDEKDGDTGVLRFKAVDIAHPKRSPIRLEIRAERMPAKLFDDFKRFGPEHKEVDEALKAYHANFDGETFIIEPNDYGVEGIGTSKLRGVLKPLEGNALAKFHEQAHAFIGNELHEKKESALLDYIISKLDYEGATGEQALGKYLEKKADKYGISKEEEERKKWRDAWRVHYALRLFQKRYAKKEDEVLEDEIKKYAPHGAYPPHYPPDYIKFKDAPSEELHGELPVEVEILEVKRHDPLIPPDRDAHEYVLNAGVVAISGMRLLFNRIADEIPEDKDALRRSRVGISIHDKGKGEVIRIDANMLIPEDRELCAAISDAESSEEHLDAYYNYIHADNGSEAEYWQSVMNKIRRDNEIVALEDPRVIERDGTIHVFLTAVKRNGKYFSAITTHDTKKFLNKLKAKEEGKDIDWEWTPLEKLINGGPIRGQNIKNAVPFGNPANGHWFLSFRPEEAQRSQIWLAGTKTENGLEGPWEVMGGYLAVNYPGFHWLGSSAYVADIPTEELHGLGLEGLDIKLIHAAAGVGDDKYYDIRLLLTDRKDPTRKYASEPILKPEKGCPYEMGDLQDCWKPGVIYSCGAILDGPPKYDFKNNRYIFDIDVYYSGSDTAMLWATVKVAIKHKGDEEKREALTRETKRISSRLPKIEPEEAAKPVEVKAEPPKRENELPEDRVVISKDNVMITRRGTHYSFRFSRTSYPGGKQEIKLTNKMAPKRKDRLPDLMIYSLPIGEEGSQHELRGIFIHPTLRGKGLARPLLNIFFAMNPDVKYIHPNFPSPSVLGLLEGEYGFRPEEGTQPNAWYKHIERKSRLNLERNARHHISFRDKETKERFIDVLPADESFQYEVVAIGEERKHVDTSDFHPVSLFSRHDLKDNEEFEKALATVPVELWGNSETARRIGEESEERRQVASRAKYPLLRDITDARQLATNLVEMTVSNAISGEEDKPFPKKLVLAFGKGIMGKEALAVFNELKRLKQDPKYRKLLQNLEIVIENTNDLPAGLVDYIGKDDTLVFMFASKNDRSVLSRVESHKNVKASYIEVEGMLQPNHYYPLAEIVTMALARHLRKDCFTGLTKDDLERINLKSKPTEKGGALFFIILPKMDKIDPRYHRDRYAILREFLQAA